MTSSVFSSLYLLSEKCEMNFLEILSLLLDYFCNFYSFLFDSLTFFFSENEAESENASRNRRPPSLPRSLSLPGTNNDRILERTFAINQNDDLPSPLTPIPITSLSQELKSPGRISS